MARCEKTTWGDYIWLAYSVFFFMEPVVRNTPRYWLENIALFLPFLALYIAYVRTRELRTQLLLLGGMVLCGVASYPLNAGASCCFTFAAAFLPFALESLPGVIGGLFAVGAVIIAEGLLIRTHWLNIAIPLVIIAVVGTGNLFIAQKKRANARLSIAQDEIERLAALAERERIARDMHDVLGHTLSVIVLKAELARRLLEQHATHVPAQDAVLLLGQPDGNLARAAAEIGDVEDTARTALAEVRKAIVGYRSEGLAAELDQARRTLRSAGVELSIDATTDAAFATLSATEETVLSLAIREAVTNIVRHAQATACLVRLMRAPEGARVLTVEDNGHSAGLREGNGLRGMRERVETLGGRLRISAEGPTWAGTALSIELPAARQTPPVPLRALTPTTADA